MKGREGKGVEIEGLVGKLKDSLGSLRRNTNSYGKSLRLTDRSILQLRNGRLLAVFTLFCLFLLCKAKTA